MPKLGPHIQLVTADGIAWAKQAPVVKTIDSIDPFLVAPPNAIRVYRHYFDFQPLDADPIVVASVIISALDGYRHPRLYVEVYNEADVTPEWMAVVVERLHAAGVNVAGPSWSSGNYTEDQWLLWREHGWAGLDAIALHAYWADKGPTPWNGLRWQQWWRRNWDPQILVTECGRDTVRDGDNDTYIGNGGWRKDGISAEQYVGELLEYDTRLCADPAVLGGTVFTAGPQDQWTAYSTDGLDVSCLWGPVPPSPSPGPGPVDPAPPGAPSNGGGQTVTELERWANDVYKRAGVVWNPDSAFAHYWLDSIRRGRYLGRPEGPEHPTESGAWIIQEFSSAVLCYDKATGEVTERIPFV